MNKIIIFFLIVSIISVHAFVKRDAPETSDTNFQKSIQDLTNSVLDLTNKAVEQSKHQFEEAWEKAKEALEKIKPTEAPKA